MQDRVAGPVRIRLGGRPSGSAHQIPQVLVTVPPRIHVSLPGISRTFQWNLGAAPELAAAHARHVLEG